MLFGLTISGLILLLLLLAIGHFYAPTLIVRIDKNASKLKNAPAFANNDEGEEITILSFDNTPISGYWTYAQTDSPKGTVILLHGIRAQKELFVEVSQYIAQEGYHAVALDLRAHGKSGGDYCTFGVHERKDISAVIDYLQALSNEHNYIGIWGVSLGGAIGLQTMQADLRIQFAIIESTFSEFRAIVHDYCKDTLRFNHPRLTQYLIGRASQIANVNYQEAAPLASCHQIDRPVMIVHGKYDQKVNINYAKANYEALQSPAKEWVEMQEADHYNIWELGGEAYYQKIMNFINKPQSCQPIETP